MNPSDAAVRRGIEAVVPYYLSQARQQTARQRRQKAPEASSPPPPVEFKAPAISDPAGSENPPASQSVPKPAAIAVFADHLPDGREKLLRFVRQTACYDGPVGLLTFEADKVRVAEYAAPQRLSSPLDHAITQAWEELFGTPPEATATTSPAQTDSEAKAFIEHVQGLCQRSDTLMIHLDRSFGRVRSEMLSYCVEAVVLCGRSQDEMIATYQTVKALQAACNGPLEIAVHIAGSSNEAQAQTIFEKLRSTAARYLNLELLWAGQDRPCEQVDETQLFSSKHAQTLFTALEQYLAAGCVPESGKSTEIRESRAEDRSASETNTVPESKVPETSPHSAVRSHEAFLRPIPLANLPQTDTELADILSDHCAIWLTEYPGLKKLEIPLPPSLHPGTRLLAEPNGQVTILQAGLHDTESLLSRALAARQWLGEHLPLIRSALCRSLQPPSGSRIVLVSLADMRGLGPFSGSDMPLPIQVKQAHLLQYEQVTLLAIV